MKSAVPNTPAKRTTHIYYAWFGRPENMKDGYIANLTKNIRLNPDAVVTLYIDSRPRSKHALNMRDEEEFRRREQYLRDEIARDPLHREFIRNNGDHLRIVDIVDQLDVDIGLGTRVDAHIVSDLDLSHIDYLEEDSSIHEYYIEIAKLVRSAIVELMLPKACGRDYAFLKDLVFNYILATRLGSDRNIATFDFDVVPVRSLESLFREGSSPLFLDFYDPAQGSSFNFSPNFFIIQGDPNGTTHKSLLEHLTHSLCKELCGPRNPERRKEIVATRLLNSPIFTYPLGDFLLSTIAEGERVERDTLEQMAHPNREQPFFVNANNTFPGDKPVEQRVEEVEKASAAIIGDACLRAERINPPPEGMAKFTGFIDRALKASSAKDSIGRV